jgi:hypothetical protein
VLQGAADSFSNAQSGICWAERGVALHNYKHVVDADAQEQEGQHAKEATPPDTVKINS